MHNPFYRTFWYGHLHRKKHRKWSLLIERQVCTHSPYGWSCSVATHTPGSAARHQNQTSLSYLVLLEWLPQSKFNCFKATRGKGIMLHKAVAHTDLGTEHWCEAPAPRANTTLEDRKLWCKADVGRSRADEKHGEGFDTWKRILKKLQRVETKKASTTINLVLARVLQENWVYIAY